MAAAGLKTPAALKSESTDPPPFPYLLDYLWAWFNEISLGMASSGMAPPQITWLDVEAWRQLCDVVIEPWEVRLIVQLGLIRASVQSEKLKPKPPKKDQKKRGGRGQRMD